MEVFQNVMQRQGDPFVYLFVTGEWYCYNPYVPPIGSGAMGDVFCGYKCKDGSPVAIKKVKDAYANNPQIRQRAKQEASLAFRHPNLVEMVGYCEYAPDNGPIFILSNFVQGENIDHYVKSLRDVANKVEKICHAICSVLDALDYVHSRGVVHRDIKPSNIMVENGSNIRLMDLGIARMNGGNKFSAYGFIGTPEYSAPEQLLREQNGNTVQINATTDIYELGITFYELLTGENPMSCTEEANTLTKQMKEKLPANNKIPSKLMHVIWKATEKEQTKRYQTALDFKRAIQEALLPDTSTFEKISIWLQDHLIGIVIAILSVAVILFLFILFISE